MGGGREGRKGARSVFPEKKGDSDLIKIQLWSSLSLFPTPLPPFLRFAIGTLLFRRRREKRDGAKKPSPSRRGDPLLPSFHKLLPVPIWEKPVDKNFCRVFTAGTESPPPPLQLSNSLEDCIESESLSEETTFFGDWAVSGWGYCVIFPPGFPEKMK